MRPRISRFHSCRFIILLWLLHCLYGCAHLPQSTRSIDLGDKGLVGKCANLFALLDEDSTKYGVRDAGDFRIPDYPYLRVNRFLASFTDDVANDAQFDAWLTRLQKLDRRARYYEIENLGVLQRGALEKRTGSTDLYERVLECGDVLKSVDFRSAQSLERLKRMAKAPDEYLSLRRAVGLYPLPLLFISEGVRKMHRRAIQSFSNAGPKNPFLLSYLPAIEPDRPCPRDLMAKARQDSLGIPIYPRAIEEKLFNLYAPVWEVETKANFDRIGAPEWTAGRHLRVNIRQPVTYKRLSYTRFEGRVLPQLNYIIWFPERPKKSVLDLVGGFMDGVNYRVTLGSDGRPVLYETVHNCGCYLKFYPTKRIHQRTPPECVESPLILQPPALNPAKERMVISMASGSHYVQYLYTMPLNAQVVEKSYALLDYNDLRSLPVPDDGRRSMFDEYGMVPGTERLERFVLWPAGVPNPGAMRQWGRRAVAFVGERHFDDPYLIQELFVSADASNREAVRSACFTSYPPLRRSTAGKIPP